MLHKTFSQSFCICRLKVYILGMIKFLIPLFIFCAASALFAQNRIGTGAAKELYEMHCASCHGQDLRGGLGNSLIEGNYKYVGKEISFIEYVKKGNLDMGMPGYEELLNDAELRSLEVYIAEERQLAAGSREVEQTIEGAYKAGGYEYSVDVVTDDLDEPWSMAFLPDGSYLITEKNGALLHSQGDQISEVTGTPEVWLKGQGGLLEVAAHPDYAENGWIYLSYASSSGQLDGKDVGLTTVVRGRINEGVWSDEEVLYEVPLDLQLAAGVHFGSRFVFDHGYLYFGIGDRGAMSMAQDLSKPNGKIHRIHDDGRVPKDNPFVNNADALPTIWSYGHRNPQGLDLNPETGEIWESEHGPRGGDEINLIEQGRNFGWPVITYGMNYNGKPISGRTSAEGMEQPKHYWTPSIAVCGIDFYEGDLFKRWKGNLLVGGLASQELHRLVIDNNEVVEAEIILKGLGRVRDVASGPDGAIYVVLNGPGRIVSLSPSAQ